MTECMGVCQGCGVEFSWSDHGTVNFCPDVLMVGHQVTEFDTAVMDIGAFDWCSFECFGRWLAKAVVMTGPRVRP